SNLARLVRENQLLLVVIKTEKLTIDISHEKILPAIAIIVRRVHSHSRARFACVAVGHARRQSNLFKSSAALIDKKKVRHRVVGYKQIHEPIVVDIGSDCAKRFPRRISDARFFANIGELAVAVVVEEMAGPGLEKTRDTIVTAAHPLIGTKNVQRLLVNYKARNKEIELAVIVIIKPDSAGRPAERGDACLIRHIGERTIAVIVIKNIAAITGDI